MTCFRAVIESIECNRRAHFCERICNFSVCRSDTGRAPEHFCENPEVSGRAISSIVELNAGGVCTSISSCNSCDFV